MDPFPLHSSPNSASVSVQILNQDAHEQPCLPLSARIFTGPRILDASRHRRDQRSGVPRAVRAARPGAGGRVRGGDRLRSRERQLVRAGGSHRRADCVAARPGPERRQPAVPSAVRLCGGDEDHPPFRTRPGAEDRVVSARAQAEGRAQRGQGRALAARIRATAAHLSARHSRCQRVLRPRQDRPPLRLLRGRRSVHRAPTIPAGWSSPA